MCSFPRAQAGALPRLHSALPGTFLSKMCPHCLYLIALPKEKQAKARPFWPAQASCLWHRKGEKQSGIVKKPHVCRTGMCCCHHFTDEETSHRRTSNFPKVTLQVSPKTGKEDRSFTLCHYVQIARRAAERIQNWFSDQTFLSYCDKASETPYSAS